VAAAAGDVEHEAFVEAVASRCPSSLAGGAPDPRTLPTAPVVERRIEKRRTEQAHLVLGVRTPGALDDDRFALELLSQALGGGVSSRLFQEVRESRGLAYSVYSYRSALHDCGVLAFYAGTSPKNAAQVVDLFHAALDDVVRDGLTDRELAIAKGQVKGSTLLGLEDSGARAGRLGRSMLVQGRVPPIDETLDRFASVTSDDIARVAGSLGTETRALAAIGPFAKSAFS
jgi:predicted Zn-dependent peptidase